jgi:ferrous iron transport protein B
MKRVALLGMPNTGKSTFFNRMTGASARVGNWPGITVDLMGAKVLLGDEMVELVDLPGIYDLHGFSDDEQVVRHFLENNRVDLTLIILNTSQIERQLALALQIKQLGLPALLLLNMSDEANRFGITVDVADMAEHIGMPVYLLSAKYGGGFNVTKQAIAHAIKTSSPTQLENIRSKLAHDDQIEAAMEKVLQSSVQVPTQLSDDLSNRLDKILLHPWFGLPIFFLVMFLLFQAIFILGKPLQDVVSWLFGSLRTGALDPLLSHAPAMLSGLLLDGIYNGVSTVAAFVPVIILFFLFMAIVEDTGYLSRAAFLMDAFMSRLGLDGRSFVMILMGFGCNVPALMSTRVMRSRSLRLLTMLTIPFSLCSARLQVFVFLTAALFTEKTGPIVLFSLYLFSFATVLLTALLYKGSMRGWHEVRHFLNRATKFIIAGVVLVWILTHFPTSAAPASLDTWAGMIGQFMQPVLHPLGIDGKLAIALIFGFVAKEIVIGSLAVIYGTEGGALM